MGIVNEKVAPWPAFESTQIRPPCCSRILRQMASRSSVPDTVRGAAALAVPKKLLLVLRLNNSDPVVPPGGVCLRTKCLAGAGIGIAVKAPAWRLDFPGTATRRGYSAGPWRAIGG